MIPVLEDIVRHKRQEVAERKALFPVKLLERSIYFAAQPVSLRKYLLRDDLSGIIAEFKRKSPSRGFINKYADLERTTIGYMQAGASALSVLTDQKFFGGNSEDLSLARKFNFCPILRKDFVIDEYQVVEARSIGADVILLIAAILSKEEIRDYTRLAHSLGMEVLLEVHGKDELDKAAAETEMIGVNNRDLKTMQVSIETSLELANLIPQQVIKISESGIHQSQQVLELKAAGYRGFLMGENFMKQARPELACQEFIKELKNSRQPATSA